MKVLKNQSGKNNGHWKGGRYIESQGYIRILKPEHHRANNIGYVCEHILVAEKVLGKKLPVGAVVHHKNSNKQDNKKKNLVICENNIYHMYLHKRMRAYKACGNPSWLKCYICKKYDDPLNIYKNNNHGSTVHTKCRTALQRVKRREKKCIVY